MLMKVLDVNVIYTDFSKAFDRLEHYILLNKLNSFGISDSLPLLLACYLSGRKKNVTCGGSCVLIYILRPVCQRARYIGTLSIDYGLHS